jgi:DNA-binding transcriptional LysR family regulator
MRARKSQPRARTSSATVKLDIVLDALRVWENRSFRRAADVLGVQESTLSRHVRELEEHLGVSLFERDANGVRATNAGADFFQKVEGPVHEIQDAASTASAAGHGDIGRLNIGILSSMATGLLRELIQIYGLRHPNVTVRIFEGASEENIAAVRSRRLDVAFIIDTTEAKGCDKVPLWTERIFVVLPQKHELSGKKEIDWTDLQRERIIVRQSERDPALCERLTKRLTAGGQSPLIQKLNVGRENLMNLVAIGRGIGLTSEATTATPFPKVAFRPIKGDDELLQFSATWLPHNDNPALRRFLSLARRMSKEGRRHSRAPSTQGPTGSQTSMVSFFLASLDALARRLGLLT